MGASMYVVNKKTTFTYDHCQVTYSKGMVIDVPAGSALLAAIGAGNLTALTPAQIASPGSLGPESDTEHMGGGQY
jgi:hypothetical protein